MTDATKRQMRAIHASRRKVRGLEEDATWRAFLSSATGKASLTAMTGPELGRVLDRLHGKGAAKPVAAPGRAQDTRPRARLARALWITLGQLGEVADPSEKALGAFAERQLGVAALQFADIDQLGNLVEALKGWCRRAGYEPDGKLYQSTYEYRVVEAQWRALVRLCATREDTIEGAMRAAGVEIPNSDGRNHPDHAQPDQLRPLIATYAQQLRWLKHPGGGDG